MNVDNIAPCPYCGSADVRLEPWGRRYIFLAIRCRTCHARGPSLIDGERLDEEEARLAWNVLAHQAEIGSDLIAAALAQPYPKEAS